jgi:hypothetical protein
MMRGKREGENVEKKEWRSGGVEIHTSICTKEALVEPNPCQKGYCE